MRSRPSLSLALAALAACASVQEPPGPSGPPPFRGVRSLVLARWSADPAGRPKDPLDALKESLDSRGYATRAVDLGGKIPPELRDLERLHTRLGSRIYGAASNRSGRRVEALGREAGAVVAALGVDAVALYHRFEGRPPTGAFAEPPPPPGALFPDRPAPVMERRPLGALSLVNRDGEALWIEWAPPGPGDDLETPANPAEAIDAILAALTGDGDAP